MWVATAPVRDRLFSTRLRPLQGGVTAKTAMGLSEPQLLLLCTSDSFGGMERIVVNLARELTSRGWLVRSVFPRSSNSAAFVDWCCGQGVTAQPSPALLPVTSQHTLRQLLALQRLIRGHRRAL